MRQYSLFHLGLPLAAALWLAPPAFAADAGGYTLTLKNDLFHPSTLQLPPDQRVTLVVKNEGSRPMEFESYDLGREKVITSHSAGTVYLGPLDPGTYKFFNDFHPGTTGVIRVGQPQ